MKLTYWGKFVEDNEQYSIRVSDAFIRHYNNFFEKGIEWRAERNQENSINEGHITEAFYAHFAQSGESFNKKRFSSKHLTSDFIGPLISAAASNKLGWWAAGDVGNLQIKALNNRLASIQSIKIMANQLIYFFSQDEFDWSHFNSIFTEEGALKIQKTVKETIYADKNPK